jgi:hypothetical protein
MIALRMGDGMIEIEYERSGRLGVAKNAFNAEGASLSGDRERRK